MKVIVAGGREYWDYDFITGAIKYFLGNVQWELVCGEAPGVDTVAKNYAEFNNIPVHSFPADWDSFGKGAGFIRNRQMAEFADGLLAIWDGKSKGTKNMIDTARELGLKVKIAYY